jgi:hypothetical protein
VQQPCYEVRGALSCELRAITHWAPVVGWATLIFCLSAMPRPEAYFPMLAGALNDKAAHAIAYGGLSILCYRALRRASGMWAARHAFVLALLACTAYGLTDEWHQYFVPFRTLDERDLLADVVGSLSALLGWRQMVE